MDQENNQADVAEVETTTPEPAAAPAPAAEPAVKQAPAKTLGEAADSVQDAPERPAAPPTWPENWRELMAGDDEAELKRLKRFTSPDSVHKSWRQAEKKISSGLLKPVKPDTDDPEKLAAWRKQVGVPDDPKGYYESLDIEVDDVDRGVLDEMFNHMHAEGVPGKEAASTVKKYYEILDRAAVARIKQDQEFRTKSEDTLRSEYGPEYRQNMNAMDMLMRQFGGDKAANKLFGARTAEGRLLGDDPDVISFLVKVARDQYPDGEIALGGSADGSSYMDTIEKEMRDLENEMKVSRPVDPNMYHNNPAKQARYRDLLIMKEKAEKRAKR